MIAKKQYGRKLRAQHTKQRGNFADNAGMCEEYLQTSVEGEEKEDSRNIQVLEECPTTLIISSH